ncbi:MAG: hypothetical protein Q8M88_16015, partial [Phenylobacterium sp.]|uniref:hypothetical protein n=1 Tax=Phenylobacterium sp. TaxID=1871053 RepID=UPI0027342855
VTKIGKGGRRFLVRDPELTHVEKRKPYQLDGNELLKQRVFPSSSSKLWNRYIIEGKTVKGFMLSDNILYWSPLNNGATSHGNIVKGALITEPTDGEVSFTLRNASPDREHRIPFFEIEACSKQGRRLVETLVKYFAKSLPEHSQVKLEIAYADVLSDQTVRFNGTIEEYFKSRQNQPQQTT